MINSAHILFFISLNLINLTALADTDVVFLEKFYPSGKRVELVKGGRFYHSAIRIPYQGQDLWLHAGPENGVELISTEKLKEIATITEIVTVRGFNLRYSDFSKYLGRKFDFYYGWDDEKIYCSELIAKLFGVPPVPMYFDPELWPSNYWKYNGQPGISPDQLYLSLKEK